MGVRLHGNSETQSAEGGRWKLKRERERGMSDPWDRGQSVFVRLFIPYFVRLFIPFTLTGAFRALFS